MQHREKRMGAVNLIFEGLLPRKFPEIYWKGFDFSNANTMASEIANISSAWPESSRTQHHGTSQLQNTLPDMFSGWSTWQYIMTILVGLIVYDQGNYELQCYGRNQLTPFLVVYLKRKGSIAGPTFKIPFIGPFIQAIHPKFESYLAQWASGPLSCVSVFHKYVFPRYAESISS